MTDPDLGLSPRVTRVLTSEEAIYGLILVSGMIVASNSAGGGSLNALITVLATVLVFFTAHVYAGTLARIAATDGAAGFAPSIRRAARHSVGMLLVAVPPLTVLLLGAVKILDDDAAVWTALILDTLLLAALGWFAVSGWTVRIWPRLLSAVITAAFGAAITLLKAFIH